MSRTTESILAELEQAVGHDVSDDHNLIDDLNEAGRELVIVRGWKWRQGATKNLDGVAGQDWIEAPADFGEEPLIVALDGSPVEIVGAEDMLALRHPPGGQVISSWGWRILLLHGPQEPESTGKPWPRFELDRTPDVAGPLFAVVYKRVWRELSEDDGEVEPNVPVEFLKPLLHKARASALRREGMYDEAGTEEQLYETSLAVLADADARARVDLGRATGGADRFDTRKKSGRWPWIKTVTFEP